MDRKHIGFGRLIPALVALLAVTAAACGNGDDGDEAGRRDADTSTTVAPEPTVAPLDVLVTNDDGYDADGIAAVVEALAGMDGIEITIVAPADERSGSGDKSTEGELAITEVEVAGVDARAVDGFPVDTVRVAVDDLGLQPDLVVSGINAGQNLGPIVDISGTVGAARAAVERGIPALAVSQGFGDTVDYQAMIPYVTDWIDENRDALAEGDAAVEVVSINVPSCDEGEVRGLAEADHDMSADPAEALAPQDCTVAATADELDGDVELFLAGYATISVLPLEPATP